MRDSIRRCLILTLLLAGAAAAHAANVGDYTLEVLVDGVPLQQYHAFGRSYVEALEGREYTLRVRNHTSRRIAVALAVDGLNTIDAGHTAAARAPRWIVGPHRTLEIEGWQTGSDTARRFFFTTEERSYGAWLGDTRNLGVISAVVFREKVVRPAPIQRPERQRRPAPGSAGGDSRGKRSADAGMAAPEAETPLRHEGDADAVEPADDLAATGIGREVTHRVRQVRFEAESRPAAQLDLRYEYRDALVRLGVLPPGSDRGALQRRQRARGFEDSRFAPDPFR